MIQAGATDSETIIAEMRKILSQAPSIEIEYISIVDAETLQTIDPHACLPTGRRGGKVLAAVAARIGPARLIDNILVDSGKQ